MFGIHMFEKLREELLERTRQQLKNSITKDDLIIFANVANDELDKSLQALTTRFREWYKCYNPELSKKEQDNKAFVAQAIDTQKPKNSIGGKLKAEDTAVLQMFAKKLQELYATKSIFEKYLADSLQKCCPNLQELAGTDLAAKLLAEAGSLRKLALMSSSKLQLLGAEKALFRHLLGHGKSPKHGVIMNHMLVLKAPRDKKGKAARLLADKLSIAAKLDYFKGDFLAPMMKKEIEGKI